MYILRTVLRTEQVGKVPALACSVLVLSPSPRPSLRTTVPGTSTMKNKMENHLTRAHLTATCCCVRAPGVL